MFGLLRRDLDYLCLPANQELKEQLTCFEYAFNPRGEILLESKDSLRRRGVVSPDIADALATTYAAEIAMLPALSDWVQPQGAIHEYDPFSPEIMRGENPPEARPRWTPAPGWPGLKRDLNNPGDWADPDAGPGEWQ
jgi:hypothetical protein